MDVKFISQDNEVQKLYAKFGMVVPVGDLSTGKAPAIQPLPSTSTQTSITAQFNVMSGADITYLSYEVWGPEGSGDEPIAYDELTPQKGVITVTVDNLEYNSGPYQVIVQAANETGDTTATTTIALQHYTNWATPDEVLLGNKYIGEDGEAHVGEIVTKTGDNVTVSGGNVTIPAGYYGEQVTKTYPVPTGTISITSNGDNQNVSGYATANVNVQPNLETVPVTPTTSAQTITPSAGYDGIGTVNVSAVTSAIDANITAGNIKNGVTILGVTGTMTGGPDAGGAVISGVTLTFSEDHQDPCNYAGGGSDIAVTFSQFPDWDFTQHVYFATLYASVSDSFCGDQVSSVTNDYSGCKLSDTTCVFNQIIADPAYWLTPNQLDMNGDRYPIIFDASDQPQLASPTSGVLVICEDKIWNQKWIIPCTITSTVIPEQEPDPNEGV